METYSDLQLTFIIYPVVWTFFSSGLYIEMDLILFHNCIIFYSVPEWKLCPWFPTVGHGLFLAFLSYCTMSNPAEVSFCPWVQQLWLALGWWNCCWQPQAYPYF